MQAAQDQHIIIPGQLWPEQGGIYAGVMRGDDNTLYHLIVAADDAGDIAEVAYGGYGKRENIAESTWDGLTNTRKLVASKIDHPAAQQIAALSLADHDDWYLPAQRELSLCWANIPDFFQKDDWYWSSTQYSPGNAWFQGFGNGYQYISGKGTTYRARAVRRLIIQ